MTLEGMERMVDRPDDWEAFESAVPEAVSPWA
jgi:hypothetical protein